MTRDNSYLVFESDRHCPLCNNSNKVILSKRMQFKLNCTSVICKNCGFCFVTPAPTKEAYNQFYREAYSIYYKKIHKELRPQDIIECDWDRFRFGIIEQFKKIHSSKILEIGPGDGRFLNLVVSRGAVCSAIEPSEEFRHRLEKNGITVIGDFLENVDTNRQFDMICFFQVLEHFHDPRTAMKKIMSLLADDGIVVLDVPNIWKPFRSLDRHFLRYVHLSYFSPNTLTRLLQDNGLEVLIMDIGEDDNIYTPQSIFVVARKAVYDSTDLKIQPNDEWYELLACLQRYRLKYCLYDAPRLYFKVIKRSMRKTISDSIIGAGYRLAKKMLNKLIKP